MRDGDARRAVARCSGTSRALRMPVLFIAGEEDVVIPPRVVELAASHVPGARFERVPEAGHSVYFERPATFNAILEKFLSES